MKTLKQSQTAEPLVFLMVLASDHLSPATGLSPTVTISKNGGAFATPSGAVTEIASGWYKVAGNATDTNTLGPLILHATAATADPSDERYQIIAWDPEDATRAGLTALPNAAAEAAGGLYTRGSGAGQINQPANGMIDGNVVRWLGTAAATPNTAGVPLIDVGRWVGVVPNALSSGKLDTAHVIRAGTAQAGAAGSVTLDSGASATDNLYQGQRVTLVSGTGVGQTRLITGYTGSTKVATVAPNWATNPDSTSVFIVGAWAGVDAEQWRNATPNALASGRVDASVGAYPGNTAQTGDAYARLGAPAGASVSADVAGVLAKTPDAVHYTNARGDNLANLDATVSSRSTLGGTAQTGDAYARLGAPAGASVSADVAAVKGDTGNLLTALAGTNSTVNDAAAAAGSFVTALGSAVDDFYKGLILIFTGGALAGQARQVTGYTGASKTIAVSPAFTAAPANGVAFRLVTASALIDAAISSRSTYAGADTAGTGTLLARLTSGRATNLDNLDATVSSRSTLGGTAQTGDAYARLGAPAGASVSADIAGVLSKTPDAVHFTNARGDLLDHLNADVTSRQPSGNVTIAGYASGQDPATLVLDVAQSAHNTAGTIGNKIGAAGSAGDPWGTSLPGSYGAGTAGAILGSAAAISGLGSGGNTILLDYGVPSLTLYAVFRDYVSKHYWNGTTLEAFTLADYGTYAVAAAEEGGAGNSGLYVITAPALPAGVYDVAVRRQAGGSPAATDQPAFDTTIIWDGSQIVLAVGGGGTGGGGTDPWLTALPGAYAAGTAGNIVGSRLDAAVSSRSTYAGGDTAGTTTLLGRLTSGRAVLLDNLDAAITTRMAAASYVAPDNADIATLVGRLTSARAALLDNLSNLDAAISSRLATGGYTAPPTVAAIDAQLTGTHGSGAWNIAGSGGGSDPATIAAAVWAAASRTLTAGGVDPAAIAGSVWAAANRSLTADPTNPAALAAAVWGAASRTLTGSGINAAAIAAAVWSNAVRTLTSQQDLVGTLPAANQITVVRGDTLDVSVPLLGDLTNRTMLTLTAKLDIDDPDSAALFQVVEGVGLTILNGAPSVTSAQATLTVATPALGIAVLHVDAAASAMFGPDFAYVFDVQVEYIGEVRTPIIGPMVVIGDVTRAA